MKRLFLYLAIACGILTMPFAANAQQINSRVAICDPLAPSNCVSLSLGGVSNAPYPFGAVPLTATSGNVANASAVATLTAVAGKTTYICGFDMSGSGATAGQIVVGTITGTIGGSLSYVFTSSTGVLAGDTGVFRDFASCIPASAISTPIVVTLPALGTGNTNAVANAHGYQL